MKKRILPLVGLAPLFPSVLSAEEKPNIVFIFADDMAYDCWGNIGADEVYTPNLDKLRDQGMAFNYAFNQGGWGGAISAASRAMLNTGRYLWKAKDAVAKKQEIAKSSAENPKFLGQYMQQAGYDTYFTGKWHVPVNTEKVFNVSRHVRGGMPKQTQEGYAYNEGNQKGRKFSTKTQDAWKPYAKEFGGFWEGGKHWSEVIGDDALDYIQMAKDDDSPFFMYLAFNAAHDPRQSPKEFVDMYPLNKISVPSNFLPTYPYYQGIGCGEWLRDEKLAPFPRTPYSVKVNRQEYYALISHMDQQIGRIIDALEQSGKLENTYIIFTADHGLAIGDHGFIGKQNMYDASMRVPLLICGPTIKKGECNELVYLQDVMATSLDIANSAYLNKVDFTSLLPLAEQQRKAKKNEYVYGAYINLQRMIRSSQYKLIIYPQINIVRFYDLKNDPEEKYDLAGLPAYRKQMNKMFKALQEEQIKTGDELDLKPAFDAFFMK